MYADGLSGFDGDGTEARNGGTDAENECPLTVCIFVYMHIWIYTGEVHAKYLKLLQVLERCDHGVLKVYQHYQAKNKRGLVHAMLCNDPLRIGEFCLSTR